MIYITFILVLMFDHWTNWRNYLLLGKTCNFKCLSIVRMYYKCLSQCIHDAGRQIYTCSLFFIFNYMTLFKGTNEKFQHVTRIYYNRGQATENWLSSGNYESNRMESAFPFSSLAGFLLLLFYGGLKVLINGKICNSFKYTNRNNTKRNLGLRVFITICLKKFILMY